MRVQVRDGEAATPARMAGTSRHWDGTYHYYVDHNWGGSQSCSMYVCDHTSDCEPLCRAASEEEVLTAIGIDALRAAQDECRRDGLGSVWLTVYPALDDGAKYRLISMMGTQQRWTLPGWAESDGGKGAERRGGAPAPTDGDAAPRS